MKKVAIMQPYFFPYLGYYQLINEVDEFISYDNVNYIKGGWINRNLIANNSAPFWINLPLLGSSSNRIINELKLFRGSEAKLKISKSIYQSYKNSPFFDDVFPTFKRILEYETDHISEFNYLSLLLLSRKIGIETKFSSSSKDYAESEAKLSAEKKLIDILKLSCATEYLNLKGGIGLYNKETFMLNGINLKFISMKDGNFAVNSNRFRQNLSIIDVLMNNGFMGTRDLLREFSIT